METANIQSVVENNIVSVALMNIQPSSYNPRKHFDEVSLAELAESIRQQGVLQPIGVRPIADTDRFEIVFGERRYRAALMVELTEISAVILHVSDETAAEMAVTENLQRKDVTPIEEANAYQKLMESGRYDVQSLAEQFGKNENYIRTRLKFVSLIPEIAELLKRTKLQSAWRVRFADTVRIFKRGVLQTFERQRQHVVRLLARTESRRGGKVYRTGFHDRP